MVGLGVASLWQHLQFNNGSHPFQKLCTFRLGQLFYTINYTGIDQCRELYVEFGSLVFFVVWLNVDILDRGHTIHKFNEAPKRGTPSQIKEL